MFKIRKYAWCWPLVLLLFSCSYVRQVGLLSGGKMKRTDFVQAVPFEWRKDLIVVRARLNADTTWREFIFDTGAFDCKVEQALADRLQLPVVAEKDNSTAQGIRKKITTVRLDSLRIGETSFYDIGAGKLAYAPSSASPCIAADGIIGANLIQLAHWKIDYQNRILYFSDTPFPAESGATVDFDRPLLSGTPTIDLYLEGKKVKDVLLDVGYNGGLVLPIEMAQEFDIPPSQIILDRSTSGIYGTNTDSLVVKELEVKIAEHTVVMPVEFSALGKTLLGNGFLQHFTLALDYDKKVIHLQKQRTIVVDPPRDFLPGVWSDSLWIVNRTTSSQPFRLGDTLLTVNGYRPGDLFSDHCDYVLNLSKLLGEDSITVQKMDRSYQTLFPKKRK